MNPRIQDEDTADSVVVEVEVNVAAPEDPPPIVVTPSVNDDDNTSAVSRSKIA